MAFLAHFLKLEFVFWRFFYFVRNDWIPKNRYRLFFEEFEIRQHCYWIKVSSRSWSRLRYPQIYRDSEGMIVLRYLQIFREVGDFEIRVTVTNIRNLSCNFLRQATLWQIFEEIAEIFVQFGQFFEIHNTMRDILNLSCVTKLF